MRRSVCAVCSMNEVAAPAKRSPNADVGKVTCPFCMHDAPIRKNSKGKFYINCPYDGLIQPALPHFQQWIMNNARLFSPEDDTEELIDPIRPPEPETRPPKPEPKKPVKPDDGRIF